MTGNGLSVFREELFADVSGARERATLFLKPNISR